MRELVYSMGVSLDGYVAGPGGDIDWSRPSEELHWHHNEETTPDGVSLYGRGMWAAMATYWPTADQRPDAPAVEVDFARRWRARPKVVFSSTVPAVDWNTRLVRGDAIAEIRRLKAEDGGAMDIGGATLAGAAVRAGLVDEYRLYVYPVLLGGGTPYVGLLDQRRDLALAQTRTFDGGVVLLRYRVA